MALLADIALVLGGGAPPPFAPSEPDTVYRRARTKQQASPKCMRLLPCNHRGLSVNPTERMESNAHQGMCFMDQKSTHLQSRYCTKATGPEPRC